MGRDVDAAQVALAQQFLVDADLVRDAQVVGDFDEDDPVLERLALFVADEGAVLVLVGVGNDHLVGVDHREAAGLDVLLLGEGEEHVEEALVDLQHLNELHHPPVGDVELAVEAVAAGIAFRADLADRRKVDAADQFGDVLGFRVGRGEGADAAAVFLRKRDPLDRNGLRPSVVDVLQVVAALRAELAFDVDPVLALDLGAQLVGDQVERLLVHWTAGDGVDRPVVGPGVALQAALEEADDRRLAAADGAHQEEDALADLEALGGGVEVLGDLIERLLDAVDVVGEEAVAALAVGVGFDPGLGDHVVDAGVGQPRDLGIGADQLEVVGEGAGPGEAPLFGPVLLETLDQIESHARLPKR